MSTSKLITPVEAAKRLHVAPETLAVWRCTGRYELTFTKIGRKVLYDEHDVDAFIQSRKAMKTQ